ncbi:MAG: VIT domain-containing protein, partial [Planctomycetia bacterium]
MQTWTDDAKWELENYLQQVARLATDRGDDPQEIVEGLRDHVTHEAEKSGEPIVTIQRVCLILAQLGSAEAVVGDDEIPSAPTPRKNTIGSMPSRPMQLPKRPFWGRAISILFHLFVAFIAFAAIFVAEGIDYEDTFSAPARMCDSLMPTPFHFWGLLLVPLGILYNLYVLCKKRPLVDQQEKTVPGQVDRSWTIRWGLILSGYIVLVSIHYMIVFLPVLPIALIATIVLIGFLPLSPYFTFILGVVQNISYWRWARQKRVTPHWLWVGVAVGFVIYGGWTIHHYACEHAIRLAVSNDPAEREKGIRRIKALHGENKVLMGCYDAFPHHLAMFERFSDREEFSRQNLQTLYYRMTGLDYRSVPRSEVVNTNNPSDFQARREWDWELDDEIGGSKVGTRVEGLSLCSSTIDVVVAGDKEQKNAGPCVAYVQWVLEFKNDSRSQREARCQIQMPPGSVGSRLTLWIDDVEQEAAFGKRLQVKKAYQEVAVVRRRDPALLTTDGPDRLFLQCFPIEPHSTMKVKVGMSVPLVFRQGKDQKTNAILRLPYLADQNFTILQGPLHEIWAEGVAPMQSPFLKAEQPGESHFAVRGKMSEADLRDDTKAIVKLDAPEPGKTRYTAELHGFSGSNMLVKNEPIQEDGRTVAIVVDTSRVCEGLKKFDWDGFFKKMPEEVRLSLFVGKNEKKDLSPEAAKKVMHDFISQAPFDAADEQTDNLERAWDVCAGSKQGLVLWIHGPMPYKLSSCSGLTQRMARRPGRIDGTNPRIASVQVVPGPNLIERQLKDVLGMFRVPVLGSMEETLDDVAANLQRPGLPAVRLDFRFHDGPLPELANDDPLSKIPTVKSSDHVVRIALGQKVCRASQGKLSKDEQTALAEQAARLRLITPLTGAVVLESKEQYAKH